MLHLLCLKYKIKYIISIEEKKKSSKVSEKLEKDAAKLHNNKGNKVENKNE